MNLRFRPRLVPSLFVIAALGILILLGTWQLNRYFEKSVIEAEILEASTAPVSVVQSRTALEVAEMNARQVKLVGRFDTRFKSHVIKHRIRNGKPGFWLLTPWVFPDETHTLVNRGWFPFEARVEFGIRAGFPTGDWTGLAHRLPRVIEDVDGASQTCEQTCVWNSYDVPGAYAKSELPPSDWVVVAGKEATVDPHPIAGFEHVTQPYLTADRHLGYVVTWYGMAAALFGLWLAAAFGVLGSRSNE